MSRDMQHPQAIVVVPKVSRHLDISTTQLRRSVSSERWRQPVLLGLFVLNLVLIGWLLNLQEWRGAADWRVWIELDPSNPYSTRPDGWMPFRYSPVAAWILHPLAIAVGPIGFVIGHFLAVLALPRRLGLIVAVSVPFWFDLLWGNVFVLVFVSAYWAMRGNRWGVLVFMVLTMLMPRPVQLPLLAWLLWRQPSSRLPFVGLMIAHAAIVLASGLGPDWITALLSTSGESGLASNFGGTRLFGTAWLIVGIPLGLWLFRRHPAWAGLAIAPYLLGQYWLMALVEPHQPVRTTPWK